MKHFYCSAISGIYCYQGLVLYESIKKTDRDFTMFLVCLDNMAYDILASLQLEHLEIIKAERLEDYYPELRKAKQGKSMSEYAWTIKSSEMLYILESYPQVDRILWIDGDAQMLADPEVIYQEWGTDSVILTEQYYTDQHESLVNTYGRFQAGFLGFRRSREGIACLKWWRQQCLDWCYNKFEDGRWADQKYLDKIPELYRNVCIVKSLGINMTPFIVYRLNYEQQQYLQHKDGQYWINGIQVVLFHYYGFRYFYENAYDLCNYWMKFTSSTIDHLYIPYIEECEAAILRITSIIPNYRDLCEKRNLIFANYIDLKRRSSKAQYDIATIVSIQTIQEALALYKSMERNCVGFYWWVCCLDDASYMILNRLNLRNTTAVSVMNIAEYSQNKHPAAKLEQNSMERLKASFLFCLLKNNYAIERILYIGSNHYLCEGIEDLYTKMQGYQGLIMSQETRGIKSPRLDLDLVGLVNCYETKELLQYSVDRPKGIFNLQDMVSKYLNTRILDAKENITSLEDLRYGKPVVENDKVILFNKPIKIFSSHETERLRSGRAQVKKNVKWYLNRELYRLIYEPYQLDLNEAMQDIHNVYNGGGL